MNHYMEIGFASWTILFPPGSSASLTVGLPAAFPRPDPTGFPRSAGTRPGRRGRDGGYMAKTAAHDNKRLLTYRRLKSSGVSVLVSSMPA
jgi:hypothetical protein